MNADQRIDIASRNSSTGSCVRYFKNRILGPAEKNFVTGNRLPASPDRGCPDDAKSSRDYDADGRKTENTGVPKMKKIALTAAAFLVATGAAFAGSDHFDPNSTSQQQPAAKVDSSYTSSIQLTTDGDGHAVAKKPITDGAPRLGGRS
jgi:hypothetical protein